MLTNKAELIRQKPNNGGFIHGPYVSGAQMNTKQQNDRGGKTAENQSGTKWKTEEACTQALLRQRLEDTR